MKTIFVIFAAFTTTMLMLLLHYLMKKEYKYREYVWLPISVGALAVATYTGFLISDIYLIAVFMHGIYLSCTNWLVLSMLFFVLIYSGKIKKLGKSSIILMILSGIDTIAFVLNVKYGFMFTMDYHADGDYWIRSEHSLGMAHFAYTYSMALVIIMMLIYFSWKEPYNYKVKYFGVLIPFCLVIAINTIISLYHLKIDVSVLCYVACAVFICFYSNYALPEVLVSRSLRKLTDTIEDAIICFDSNCHKIYQNKKADLILGDLGDTATVNDYMRLVFPNTERENFVFANEHAILNVDGKKRTFVVDYDNSKKQQYFCGSYIKLRDCTDEVERLKKNHEYSTRDSLTGLYNRNGFFEKVEESVRNKTDVSRVMICSNIKGFKLINKFFGEEMGDKILIKEAEMLKRFASDNSVSGRIMDDKFAVFLEKENMNLSIFLSSIKKIQEIVSDGMYNMTIHMGIYEVEDNLEPAQIMYDKAKLALDELGDDYQQIISFYNSSMMDKILAEKNVLSEFDHALREKEYVMYLHPQTTPDGEVLGAEALVRWKHRNKSIISPGYFVPVLENSGLIYQLDRYMWEEAASLLGKWKNTNKDKYYISVNLSIKDFYYMDIYSEFVSLVEKYDISPQKLKIEITETVLMMEYDKALELYGKLQEYGFYVEIDDFGSGYSSLNMLKDVRADVLKIDMQFLRGEDNPRKNKIILEAIIATAKELKMQVIAEGVENLEQVEMLKELGCDVFQGSYYGSPMPIEEFEGDYLSKCNM